jgi:serine/threonine-protein kinase HSL1 (negative regulator of Swe1 kinase)
MAALETSDRMLETSCGSPHYASPEIVGGKSYHGAPSDIWSCGIILFALLTGHLPFDDDNIRKLLYKVQEGKFHMPPELSPQAKDLIWKMLKVKPEDRITMPDILKHSLLRKYPAKLPSHGRNKSKAPIDPELVARPVQSQLDVDPEILKNLQTLWHGVSTDIILQKLLSDEPNSEKTFYCLLLKYRHDHSETTTVSKKKKISNSTSSNYILQSNTSPRRSQHRRTSSGGSSVVRRSKSRNAKGRNASRSRSHSRTRSHSRIIYSHTRSASKSSIVSSSSHRRHSSSGSNGHMRTKSNASIVSCSPPPPLPSEAVQMVEAELRQQQADSQESSDFVSMLEQAFNFDKKQAATSRALSNPINPASTAYSESNRRVVSEPHKDYVNHDVPPKLTKSPIYQYSSSFDTSSVREIPPPGTPSIINITSTTTLPLKNNSDVYLPIELEEDRFADAIEEEMDLHLKKSFDYTKTHQHYLHQQQLQLKDPQKRHQQKQQHRPELERVRSPVMLSQTKFGDNNELYKSLNLLETPNIHRDNDDSCQQHIPRLPSSENSSTKRTLTRSGDSRLHISSLLKTDSFNTINGDNKRPKSMLALSESSTFYYPSRSSVGQHNSSMLLEPTYRYSSSTTLLTNSNNPRHSAPSNILLNNNNNSRRYEEGIQEESSRSNSPNKLRAVSAYERTTTPATGVRQLPATGQPSVASQTPGLNNSKGGSSLFRKFSLTPKRAAPAAPVNGHPQQPIIQSVTPAGGDTYENLGRNGNINPGSTTLAPKSRIISHSETIKTTTTRATSGTTWKSTASSRMTSTVSTPATVSAPTYDQPEVLKMPVSKQDSGPKQNWFMKMLKTVRSETKGYYSSYSAGTLRRMIVQILVEWQRYGISNISEDTTTSTIRAKISSRNVLSLRSSKFRIEIETHLVRSSYYTKPQYLGDSASKGSLTSIVIVQERGSTSSFLRFVGELENALDDRNALIMREGQTFQGAGGKMLDNPLGIYA